MKKVLTLSIYLLLGASFQTAYGQLDSKHWLPPLEAEIVCSNIGVHLQRIYLITPEISVFNKPDGTAATAISTSNSSLSLR